jgi:hypothetical protein
MDAWENRRRNSSAVALALATGFRLANVIAAFGFGLSVLPGIKRRFADAAVVAAVIALVIGVQMLVNHRLGGYWLVSGYASRSAAMYDKAAVLENLALYVGGLALLPPFPLVFALARPKRVDRWALIGVLVFAAYVPIVYHNVSPSLLETLVGGQRFMLPVHGALMVATAGSWTTAPVLQRTWLPVGVGVLMGVIGSLAMARLENRHRPAVEAVASCRPGVLAYNRFANRVAGSVEATSYRLVRDATDATSSGADWDVLIMAPGYLSHQPGHAPTWAAVPGIAGASCRQVGPYAIYDRTGRCLVGGQACTSTAPS